MDIDRIRYFSIVARTGSIRKAAELLQLSPAALSKAIKLLEQEVGRTLLIPDGRGIRVTDQGFKLADQARPLLDDLDELRRSLTEEATHEDLRLASFEVFTTYFLGQFGSQLGNLRLQVFETIPGDMEAAIENGMADYGITYIPIPRTGLEHLAITRLNMGVFGTRAWKDRSWEDLPFVVPNSPVHGSPTKVLGLDGFPDDLIRRNIRYRVSLLESALELCRQGAAVGYFPTFVVRLHNQQVRDSYQLVELGTPNRLLNKFKSQKVYLIKRKSSVEDKNLRFLAKMLRLLC